MNTSQVGGRYDHRRLAISAVLVAVAALLLSLLQALGAGPARASDYTFTDNGSPMPPTAVSVAPDGSTYAAGMFTMVDGAAHQGIVKFDTSGAVVGSWNGDLGPSGIVLSVLATNDRVYVGGGFGAPGPAPYFRVLRADTGALDTGFLSNNFDGAANAIVLSGSTLYLGGDFTMFKYGQEGLQTDIFRSKAAALDAVTGQPTNWAPQPDSSVNAMVLSGTTMYLGGQFTHLGSLGGAPRQNLGAVSTADTGTVTAWDPTAGNISQRVESMAMSTDGTKIYFGGRFTTVGGQARNRLAAATVAGVGAITSWDPNLVRTALPMSTAVAGIVVANGTIVAGGTFDLVGGSTARGNVAAWRESDGALSNWTADTNSGVSGVDISVTSPTVARVFISGFFSSMTTGATTPLVQQVGVGQLEILAMPATIPPQAKSVSRTDATLNWSDPWFGGQQKVWVLYKLHSASPSVPQNWKTFGWSAGGGASAGLTRTSISLAPGACPTGWTCPRPIGYVAGQTYDFDVIVTSWDNRNSAGPLTAEVTYTVPSP